MDSKSSMKRIAHQTGGFGINTQKVTKKQAQEFCKKLGLTKLRKINGEWVATDDGGNNDYVINLSGSKSGGRLRLNAITIRNQSA